MAESLWNSWREMAQRPATDRNAHPFPSPPYLRPSRFSLPCAEGVVLYSPALPRVRIGKSQQPQRGCAEATNGRLDRGNPNQSWRCRFGRIGTRSTNLPVWCDGTTPSGLLIYWPFPQGSASVAQPWALWQNPVGIPGGGYPTPSEQTPSSSGFPKGYCQRFPHLCSSAPICG